MPTPIVIDLSHHNEIPSSLKLARTTGIIGLIHKASEGTSFKDSKVDAREYMAREARMLFGLYHFIRPGNTSGQINNFLGVYKRYSPADLLVVLDYEDDNVSLDDAIDWLIEIEAVTNKRPVIYSGHTLKDKLSNKPHAVLNGDTYPLWLAQYTSGTPSLPPGWDSYWLWQYTDKGTVAGVTPPTDLNAGDVAIVTNFWADKEAKLDLEAENARLRDALTDIRKRADEALGG